VQDDVEEPPELYEPTGHKKGTGWPARQYIPTGQSRQVPRVAVP